MTTIATMKATDSTIEAMIIDAIREHGLGADLNYIDVSNVTNMSGLFRNSRFFGDISKWDMSNVKDISYMFYSAVFSGDISKWDMSKVTKNTKTFMHARFSGDLSEWKMKSEPSDDMFKGSKFCGRCGTKWYTKGTELNEDDFVEKQLEMLDL